MHIVIALLTAFAGVVWALIRLQNSGVDLNSFNPFFWARRRKWEKQLGTKPLHQIDNSMEAAAVLVLASVKLEGELSKDQKQGVISLFQQEFNLSADKATEMFSASSFLLQGAGNYTQEIASILAPTKDSFTASQIAALSKMLDGAIALEGVATESQSTFVAAVKQVFPTADTGKQW